MSTKPTRCAVGTGWLRAAACALGLVPAVAAAGVPLIHDDTDPQVAMVAVVHGTGLPADQLDPIALSEVLQARPSVVGAGALRHCAGAASRNTDVRAHLVRAEAAWREGDYRGAMDQADLGIAGLGCLSERVERPEAARLFLLRGGLIARDGHDDAAREELRTALALSPRVQWDEWLPSEGRVLLAQVRAEPAEIALGVAPESMSVGPWLDGSDPTDGGFTARQGLHLVQVPGTGGLATAWLTLEADAVVVVPRSFRPPVLSLLADPATRSDVERLVQAASRGMPAYVASGGGVWLLTFEDGVPQTETLVEPPPPPADDAPETRKPFWKR